MFFLKAYEDNLAYPYLYLGKLTVLIFCSVGGGLFFFLSCFSLVWSVVLSITFQMAPKLSNWLLKFPGRKVCGAADTWQIVARPGRKLFFHRLLIVHFYFSTPHFLFLP
jgi:hypothetical protein